MVPAALGLVVLGSVSFALLVSALLQSTFSGSVEVVLLGGSVGRISIQAALLLTIAATACVGLGALGLLLLRRRGERNRTENTDDRDDGDAVELEARARLLEYRIQLLSEQVASLVERKDALTAGDGRTPLVPAAVEPKLVPGHPPAGRPLQQGPQAPLERMRLVVVPQAEQPASANGHGSA